MLVFMEEEKEETELDALFWDAQKACLESLSWREIERVSKWGQKEKPVLSCLHKVFEGGREVGEEAGMERRRVCSCLFTCYRFVCSCSPPYVIFFWRRQCMHGMLFRFSWYVQRQVGW